MFNSDYSDNFTPLASRAGRDILWSDLNLDH